MVPMARMSPQDTNVCFAISIEAEASNSPFLPLAIIGRWRATMRQYRMKS